MPQITDPALPILSASRRTDIPAFFLADFMTAIARGSLASINPFNRHRRQIAVQPSRVHSIVFWSKNYGPLLDTGAGVDLKRRGYRMLFHFTLNSADPLLEPRVPPLAERLDQLAALVRTFGPQAVVWRFDPICHYRRAGAREVHDNLADLPAIAARAAALGLRTCTTSFVDPYAKVVRRFAQAGFHLVDPPLERKTRILADMARRLAGRGIALRTCCEKTVVDMLPAPQAVRPGACISADQLAQLHGPGFRSAPDRGQRRRLGCGCNVAVDIGDYQTQPCAHACLYCYANTLSAPVGDTAPAACPPHRRAS